MIVPEKPLWGGNNKVCMHVTPTLEVDAPQLRFVTEIVLILQ